MALAVPLVVPLIAAADNLIPRTVMSNGAGAANVVEARERRAMVARLKGILKECIVTRRNLEKFEKDK